MDVESIPELSAEGERWLSLCRRVAVEQSDLTRPRYPDDRFVEYGIGHGGDRSLKADLEAEDIVFRELHALNERWSISALSEERGAVVVADYGPGARARRVVIDPLDGSFNAKRGIPAFAVSIAVASGDAAIDVFFAFVCNLATADEFVAERERGAWHNGQRIGLPNANGDLEVVGLESVETGSAEMGAFALELTEQLGRPFRARIVGSTALALCDLAVGRFDGLVSIGPCRTVDFAAAQLIVRESGREVAFDRGPLDALRFDLERHHRFVGATHSSDVPRLIESLGKAQQRVRNPAALHDWH